MSVVGHLAAKARRTYGLLKLAEACIKVEGDSFLQLAVVQISAFSQA